MFEDKTRVLLVVPQQILDRARVFAGSATTRLKRPVSLQMVLRALIDEGLKRNGDRAVSRTSKPRCRRCVGSGAEPVARTAPARGNTRARREQGADVCD